MGFPVLSAMCFCRFLSACGFCGVSFSAEGVVSSVCLFSVGSVFLSWPCGNFIKGRGGIDKLGVVRWVWFCCASLLEGSGRCFWLAVLFCALFYLWCVTSV